ncbi:hypothetical protein KFK09_023665 [Dendrobium nobile]|uniref:Uncharacterized protein n=1 Tax=Dendrobium nobile TaxID=94219 RepID=A0A8T3AAD4_DENNO|nr:hypothetical protein KFK09_023665 [Dendrobium nobile]
MDIDRYRYCIDSMDMDIVWIHCIAAYRFYRLAVAIVLYRIDCFIDSLSRIAFLI